MNSNADGGSATGAVSKVVQPVNSSSIPSSSCSKRKDHPEDETGQSEDDCMVVSSAVVCDSIGDPSDYESEEYLRLFITNAVKKFKNSSKAFAARNKKLRMELVAAKKQIEYLNTPSSMAQVHKTLMNNAVTAAIQYERAEGLKATASEITKAKYSINKEHEKLEQKLYAEINMLERSNANDLQAIKNAQAAKEDKVKAAINELRFTEMFGVNSARGTPFCVVTQSNIMPIERVYALITNCKCKHMIKHSHGGRYMNDFQRGDAVCCFSCNEEASDLVATTAKAAEVAIAWCAIEELTKCDDEQTVVDRRTKQIDDEEKDKKTQDTKVFRNFIESFVKSAPET